MVIHELLTAIENTWIKNEFTQYEILPFLHLCSMKHKKMLLKP